MSNEWDINAIRKIAGLPLMEAFGRDEDDDEDPDAKIASSDKRQAAFEKKNKNEMRRAELEAKNKEKVAAKKAEEAKAEKKEAPKPAEKKAEEKPAEKKEEPKAAEKKEESNESNEAKKRGRTPSDSSKMGQARAWLQSHPEASRSEFMKHAESFNMSRHYANAFFYSVKKKMKVTECFILVHPTMPSFVLAENRELNQMQWVDPTSPLEPMIFEKKAEAEKIAKYMSEWKSQYADIQTIKLID